MRLVKRRVTVVTRLALALTISLVAVAATAPPALAGPYTFHYRQSAGYGSTSGTSDYNPSTGIGSATGSVKDLDADGHCVFARITFTSGETRDTPRACPKGSSKSYRVTAHGQVSLVKMAKIQT
ncbi:hypothetical protein Acy02nite_88860 [Actinoplanes cyaneus]|uniref:Secreted protein n=2 Tax=Actinoplanes cyaneus TaxID=52696 RepID=A0A919IZK0_9ACTN|nr:hypothetical protein [Actinoplanes cyaneus]GID71005.1 hypothetical protein Acy02nite_88860 [Actinoplanes cyaneus]